MDQDVAGRQQRIDKLADDSSGRENRQSRIREQIRQKILAKFHDHTLDNYYNRVTVRMRGEYEQQQNNPNAQNPGAEQVIAREAPQHAPGHDDFIRRERMNFAEIGNPAPERRKSIPGKKEPEKKNPGQNSLQQGEEPPQRDKRSNSIPGGKRK